MWTLINFLVFTNAFYKIDATFLIVPCSYDQYCPERLIWHSNCHYFLLIIRIERPFTDNLQAIPRGSHLFRIFALDQVSNTFMMFSFNTKSWQPSIAVFFLFFLFSASGAWGDRTRDWGVGPGKRILIFNDPWRVFLKQINSMPIQKLFCSLWVWTSMIFNDIDGIKVSDIVTSKWADTSLYFRHQVIGKVQRMSLLHLFKFTQDQ